MNIEQLQNLPDAEKAKLFAAWHALAEVESGMKIGIGTGSTAVWFIRLLAGKQQSQGLKFRACATSSQTTELAESLGIKIELLDDLGELDLVIDGADEFDPDNNLIKGGGGALLQEKIVAQSAKRFIVITDASKEVKTLGKFPLPVEIVKFSQKAIKGYISCLLFDSFNADEVGGQKIIQRIDDNEAFTTDEDHYILDLHLKSIKKPYPLDGALCNISGVVETGLFFQMANAVVMADSDGLVKSRETGGDWIETRYDVEDFADILADIQI